MSTLGAVVLAGITIVACWRIGRRRPWLFALQPILAAALWWALWPPAVSRPGATLVVATAHASGSARAAQRKDEPMVALPEAPALAGAQPVPDLATALRRLPSVGRLRVLGDGLVARDRSAVGARGVDFDPGPEPAGVRALFAATRTVVGQPWTVRGRVVAPLGARVELLDPAGASVGAATIEAGGAFVLGATPPSTGRVEYDLRLRNAAGRDIERLSLPLDIVAGRQPRLWLLSGGPDPEQKFLRRWAEDGGWRVRSRASLGGGLQVGDPIAIDSAALADVDLLVLDQRALRGLGPGARTALRRGVRSGLGLLLRLQEAPTAAERTALRELGFSLASTAPAPVRLPGARAPYANEEITTLLRAPLQADANDAVVLMRDADGAPLARWRALGQGRIAAWWTGDSYRLVLSGQAPLYAQLWSQATQVLARPDAPIGPRVDAVVWAQQRAAACGLRPGAQAIDPGGKTVALLVDARGCAGWWPAAPGWHRIQSGARSLAWPVLAADAWPGVRGQLDREATLALRAPAGDARNAQASVPGPRWPGFLAWLLVSGLAWWLERRRPPPDEPQADAR